MPTIQRKPYFYDSSIKRILLQVMSCFAGFQVKTGKQRDGKHRFIDVPIMFGDYSNTVKYLMNAGETTVPAVPIMSLELNGMQQADEYRRAPMHTEQIYYNDRISSTTGQGDSKGPDMVMERYMPVPYEFSVSLHIWASNNDQGYQIIEQICTLFNPEMELQLSNSPGDWTFLTTMYFQGDVKASRVATDIGNGNSDDYYVWTLDFVITPVYISPPVKIFEADQIEQVRVAVKDLYSSADFDEMDDIDTIIITAGN